MRSYNKLLVVVIIFTTTVLMWVIPPFVRELTLSPVKYPMGYYSSRLETLCLNDFNDKEFPMRDKEGNRYNSTQYDTLLPLLNFRRLMGQGLLPDSMRGVETSPRTLMTKSVVFNHKPSDYQRPHVGLYGLLESMPLRGSLETPTDLFRIKERIEFIDAESNRVDVEKSAKFANLLERRGYRFPTAWAKGDCNTRKAYDEGYFTLDAKGRLFHLKMVNSNPYVKDTEVSESVDVLHYVPYNAPDRRFYGFIFSREGGIYILEGDAGVYTPRKIDIPQFDLTSDNLTIMGNIFYWSISVTNESGRSYYAVNSDDLMRVDSFKIERSRDLWDVTQEWLMPLTISFQSNNSYYIYPRVQFGGFKSLVLSLLLSLVMACVSRKERLRVVIFKSLVVLVSGVAGFAAILLLPEFRKINK